MAWTLGFIDGFDYCSTDRSLIKYEELSSFQQTLVVNGRQPPNKPSGGYAWFPFNSAFGFIQRQVKLGSSAAWLIGLAFQPVNAWIASTILRFDSPPETVGGDPVNQLSVALTADGHIVFTCGAIQVAAPPAVFEVGQWVYLEIQIGFGNGGSIEVRVDDLQVSHDTNLNVGLLGHMAPPDRFSFYWQHFGTAGYAVDDVYVATAPSTVTPGFLGPCRVTTTFPAIDQRVGWTRNTGAHNFNCLNEALPTIPAPDLDSSYVEAAGSSGAVDLYSLAPMACYGVIQAVAVNVCARKSAGLEPQAQVLARPDPRGANVAVGPALDSASFSPAYIDYGTRQAIQPTSLVTGGRWLDREIDDAWWGFQAAGLGSSRVTQFFIEKLVSLRNQPFDCGKGASYSI